MFGNSCLHRNCQIYPGKKKALSHKNVFKVIGNRFVCCLLHLIAQANTRVSGNSCLLHRNCQIYPGKMVSHKKTAFINLKAVIVKDLFVIYY